MNTQVGINTRVNLKHLVFPISGMDRVFPGVYFFEEGKGRSFNFKVGDDTPIQTLILQIKTRIVFKKTYAPLK